MRDPSEIEIRTMRNRDSPRIGSVHRRGEEKAINQSFTVEISSINGEARVRETQRYKFEKSMERDSVSSHRSASNSLPRVSASYL